MHTRRRSSQPRARRFATSFAFACLFFAGAAFTAGAGNLVAHTDEPAAAESDAVAPAPVTPDPFPPATATPVTEPAPDPVPTAPAPRPATAPGSPTDSATDGATDGATDDVAVAAAPARTGYAAPAPAPASSPAAASFPARAPAHARTPRRATPLRRPVAPPAPAFAAAAVPFAPAIPFDLSAWEHANPASSLGATAVAIARHFVGTPYVWGGASPSGGFDCSGLMQYVYGQLGISLPHYAATQFAIFPRLSSAQLRPGDLVFFEPKIDGPGHVAMYVGGDEILEAPHTDALVRVGSLSRSAAALGFMGAVRPYTGEASALRLTAIHRSARTASGPGTTDLVFAV